MTLPLTDLELERSLIAVALHDFGKFTARGVAAEDFGDHECRTVFELAQAIHADGHSVTHHAIVASVKHPERAMELAPKLAGYRATVPPDHERLRHLRRLRDVRQNALYAASRADVGELDEAVAALEGAQRAAIVRDGSDTVLSIDDLAGRFLERLLNQANTRHVHLGMPMFSKAVGPLAPGSMTIIGADTNVGKTGYALEILASTVAGGTKCGFISCEDPEDIVVPRLIAAYSNGLSSRSMQMGSIAREDGKEIERALEAMLGKLSCGLFMSFPIGGTELDVCGEMSRMVSKGAKVVAIDYIQTIEPSKKQQDRRNEIRWMAARLKEQANRLKVPLILLSQLTIPPGAPPGWEPNKHALKECRDLANAAECVVLMWRQDDYDGAPVMSKLDKSKVGNVGATWSIVRDGNAVVREVQDSYLSGFDNFKRRQQMNQAQTAQKGWNK